METVTKILIKMRPLSIDGAILILVLDALYRFLASFFPVIFWYTFNEGTKYYGQLFLIYLLQIRKYRYYTQILTLVLIWQEQINHQTDQVVISAESLLPILQQFHQANLLAFLGVYETDHDIPGILSSRMPDLHHQQIELGILCPEKPPRNDKRNALVALKLIWVI